MEPLSNERFFMDKKYDHKEWEEKIYKKWEELGVFSPEKSIKMREDAGLEVKKNADGTYETYTVLIPPPNANAPLHCGHATYAIQDLMTRFKRMQGYKTLYVPGTDHAGFETQVVYERKLKKEGKSRFDFDRETLYNDILNFVLENSDMAIDQLKKMGMSCDWDRSTFMLDQHVIDTVYDTFQKMHKDGLVYRDDYLVNYSPTHGTTFSNLETEHVEEVSPLYYVKYKIKDSDEFVTVATGRPETIYADVAIAVNPKDKKYKKYVGKVAINPLNSREMKIIEDEYVDIDFGTGALKITPGHDFNDYEIGKKHNLPMISVVDLEGKMTKEASDVAGMRVHSARKKTVEILEEKGALEKIDEKYTHNLLVDYKDKKPIEPMLLPNWFVKMTDKKINLASMAIEAIRTGKVKYNRNLWKRESLKWLENIHDWPISRQTVFGIRIPIWYYVKDSESNENGGIFVVFIDKDGNSHEGLLHDLREEGFSLDEIKEGLQKVIVPKDARYEISAEDPGKRINTGLDKKAGQDQINEEFIPETDTFDTWFSSGQWPFATLRYPDGDDYKEFFPTQFMDSMWDILFFWIARMIMFSLYLTKDDEDGPKVPYENVYIHGRIDDEKGQKMSKSKGNVIDPLEFVEKYGADALRMGMLVGGNSAARTTSFSADKVRGYRNFANKIWNMGRFMIMMADSYKEETGEDVPFLKHCTCTESCDCNPWLDPEDFIEVDVEILNKYSDLVTYVTENLEKYRFMEAGDALYHFLWHEIADIYIEDVKNREDIKSKRIGLSVLRHVFLNSLKLLHPFMPFVTEAVWENIPRKYDNPIAVSKWPEV
ncbi:valine--tRNA ligase [Patescibacteria group bacterium]|nr:valine--tRNA ligase [Patescibacteria group bacterium]